MSDLLDRINTLASDENIRTVALSPLSATVLLTALAEYEQRKKWLDRANNPLDEVTDADFDAIERLVGIAYDELMTDVTMNPFYIGEIRTFAFNTEPQGWAACAGQAYAREYYADLFAVIGTTFGAGNGTTTFNLPDLRKRMIVNWDTSSHLANTGGEETHTLTLDELPAHNHNLTVRGSLGAGSVARSGSNDGTTASFASQNAGGGQAHNNMPPYLMLTVAIYHGVMD